MSIGSELGEEMVPIFDQETKTLQRAGLSIWLNKIISWISLVNSYLKRVDMTNDTQKRIYNTYSSHEAVQDLQTMFLKQRERAEAVITMRNILTEGYALLTQIGESIRRDITEYSITLNVLSDTKLSSLEGQVYTWYLSLNDFLKYATGMSGDQLVLRKMSGVFRETLDKHTLKQPQEWSDAKRESFLLFMEQVANLTNGKWEKINEGNMLEAFLRFGGSARWAEYSDHAYWRDVYRSISMTMADPDAFWKGGDVDDEQIKGYRADITNLQTLLDNIYKVFNLLLTSPKSKELIRSKVRQKFVSDFDNREEQAEEEIIDQLIDMFTGNIVGR